MSTLVKKIIFRDNDLLNRLYLGNELIFYTEPEPVVLDYLTFTTNKTATILYTPSKVTTAQYSYDKVNWKTADNVTLKLNTGDKVYFKGNITGNQNSHNSAYFTTTGEISASGSIMSLQEGNPNDKTIKYEYAFNGLFYGCLGLTTAPELPAVNLSVGCYAGLFMSVNALTTAPYLPSWKLPKFCYSHIFSQCKNLNYVKCDAKECAINSFHNWLNNVAPTGDIYCYDANIFKKGSGDIPTGWTVHKLEPKEYDALYVSGRYEFKIPKVDGKYYVIDTKNDCEADVITDNDFTSLNQTIISSNSRGDMYEWELFFAGTNLYFDLSFKNNRRLSWKFGTITKDTKYTIGGSNGNYLGTDRAIYINGSKKVSSTTKSYFNNESNIIKIGENVNNVYIGNIKIYEETGLVYNIVPIMYKGKVEFFDKVNIQLMEIVSTPPSDYVRTRATGEKVII